MSCEVSKKKTVIEKREKIFNSIQRKLITMNVFRPIDLISKILSMCLTEVELEHAEGLLLFEELEIDLTDMMIL